MKSIKNNFSNDIIFVDGFWGSGKSLISPILSAFKNVEIQKIKPEYEYIPLLEAMGKLEKAAAIEILNLFTDTNSYNSLISREVNFRYKDFTSVFKKRYLTKYIRRLFIKDGDNIVNKINSNNIAMHFVTHLMFIGYPILKETFGDRLKFIQIVRHPLYLINHWNTYLKRWDNAREFTLSFTYKNIKIPWFANEYKDEYIALNEFDKVIWSLIKLYESLFNMLNIVSNESKSFKVICFESLVFNTTLHVKELEIFLERETESYIFKVLKEQKLPRNRINDGIGYVEYGWQKDDEKLCEINIYNNILAYTRTKCTANLFQIFLKVLNEYETRWPFIKTKLNE